MNNKFRKKFRKGFKEEILIKALESGYDNIESYIEKEEVDIDTLRRAFYNKMKAECEC